MIKVKRHHDAVGLLNAAIEADPNLSEAYQQRATAFLHLCRYVYLIFCCLLTLYQFILFVCLALQQVMN